MPEKQDEKDSRPKTTTFRSTEAGLKKLADESWDRGLVSKGGKGRGSFQALVEYAVDLFLCVSAERYRAGDIQRLKDFAAFLALPPSKTYAVSLKLVLDTIAGALKTSVPKTAQERKKA